MMVLSRRVRCAAALLVLAALFGRARAFGPPIPNDDYTVSYPTGRYVTPPANATQLNLTPNASNGVAEIVLPFRFSFFGWVFDRFYPGIDGYGAFTDRDGGPASSSPNNSDLPTSVSTRGMVAPLWDDLSASSFGKLVWWTDGTAPNRRVIVSWEGVGVVALLHPSVNVTFQVHLHETSNRIVFAYKADEATSTWLGLSYTAGLGTYSALIKGADGYGDQRFADAFNHLSTNSGHPPSDVQFDQTSRVRVTGKVVYDRVVSDATGVGGSVQPGTPAYGARIVATQPSDGFEIGSAYCDATGAFELVFQGRPLQAPIIYVEAQSRAVAVKLAAGAATLGRGLVQSTTTWTDTALGTFEITAASDSSGALRSALAIVGAVESALSVVEGAGVTVPPQIDVYHDPSSTGLTLYQRPDGTNPSSIRIGSAGGLNEDAWDRAMVVKAYARHVLATIAGPAQSFNPAFDAVSDAQNAFAEGFGYFLHAIATGSSVAIDGIGPAQSVVVDLETFVPQTRKGADVGAWVASALYDLADGANEPHDRVDGTATAIRVYRAAESLAAAPNASSFTDAWIALGYDGLGLSRLFVADGLIPDDAGEPNDDAAEPRALGAMPLLSSGRVLAKANEDWYSVTLAAPVAELRADVAWNRGSQAAQVTLELVGPSSNTLATGAPQGPTGPYVLASGPLAAGTYRIRLRHDAGPAADPYRIQVYEPLALTNVPRGGWTVDRPMSELAGARGGLPPLTLAAEPVGSQPPGLYFSLDGQRVLGTPTTPGSYQLSLSLEDAGDPVHRAVSSRAFVVNPPLDFEFAPYVGFPAGRPFAILPGDPGGTDPRTFAVSAGVLPAGVALDPSALRIHGTAAAASARVTVHGSDVAGSEDTEEFVVVGTVALTAGRAEADLAAGDAACGVFVDALKGSSISFAAGTVKGQAKRALTPWLVGSDGREIAGAKLSPGTGKSKGSAANLPVSGRWFAIFSSQEGPASRLSVSATATPSKGAKGAAEVLDAAHPLLLEFGALAGASIDLTLKPEKGSGLVASVQQLLDPSGASVPLAGLVTEKNGSLRLVAPLASAGTWTVRISARTGTEGGIAWSYKLKQPKGVVYSAE